jgi:anaerobic selenocysteine-containing dehydrogenase
MRERGCRIVQLDPRYNETSKVVDQHHFIRPDTDAYFLAGMLREVFKNEWDQTGHLSNLLPEYTELIALTEPFTPQRVEAITGVPAATLIELTKDFATTERAVIYGRMGVSTQRHGGLCHWLIAALNILTGHCDRPGGAMFTQPAVDVKRSKKFRKIHDRWRSRVRQLPEFMGELPVATLADEILTPGEGQIRAMIIHAGNPVLSSPNGKRLDDAFGSLDFCVSIDIYLNETSRHADLILPPPSHLEEDHYDLIYNLSAVRNNAKFSPALFEPAPGQRYDWQIARALIERLATESKKKPDRLLQRLNPRQLLNLGLMTGPYGKLSSWKKLGSGLSLKKLRNSVHGIDLGALQSCIESELRTKSGKIELMAPVYVDALKGLADTVASGPVPEDKDGRDFQLIGRRHLRSNNSWMHNVKELVRGKQRCTLLLHPDDATRIGAIDGGQVVVVSRTGRIQLPASIDASIMPGVVSIPHGFGHHGKGTRLSTAASAAVAGVSLNDITDHERLDPLTGNAAFSGQWVSLEVVDE